MVDPHEDPIELVESRHREWVEAFETERERVEGVLADAGLAAAVARIEHVGSTAVPDLAAKDIVDLDVVVDPDRVAPISTVIADGLGGDRYENSGSWQPVFRRADGQRFNDHVFARTSERWKMSVATRDVLRTDAELRDAYEARKRELAAETDELGTYGRGKTPIVERLLERAREEAADDFAFEVPTLE